MTKEYITLKLKDIKPYDKNPRKNEAAVPDVAESIKQVGYITPIVVDEDNVVLCGHTRLKALKRNGETEADGVLRVSGLTEEQKRKYRLLDNKTNEKAEWDFDLLAEEIADLDFSGFDLDWGIPETEEEKEIIEDEVPEIDLNAETRCKKGDIWKLGNSYLICGDSTEIETIEQLMGDDFGKADACITDPPYNVDYEGKTDEKLKIGNDNQESLEFQEFLTNAFSVMRDAMKEGASFYVWHASRTQREFENALNDAGLCVRQQLIWAKNSLVLGRQDYQWKHEPCFYGWKDGASHNWYNDRGQTTVLEFDRPTRNDIHPTMKPVDLIAYQIRNSSKKGDIIIDFFGGSGTTLIACEQLDRRCYTCELDEHYCDAIIKRWENMTNREAEKIAGGGQNDLIWTIVLFALYQTTKKEENNV